MKNDHRYEEYINQGFENFLLTRFDRMEHVKFDSNKYIVNKPKSTNSGLGPGSNPDFIVATGNLALFNIKNIHYHCFELKRSITDALNKGTGQAQNYLEFSRYSYIACPVSEAESKTNNFSLLRKRCRNNKIGLITFINSNFPDSYEINLPAKENKNFDEDRLLKSRAFIQEHYTEIKSW